MARVLPLSSEYIKAIDLYHNRELDRPTPFELPRRDNNNSTVASWHRLAAGHLKDTTPAFSNGDNVAARFAFDWLLARCVPLLLRLGVSLRKRLPRPNFPATSLRAPACGTRPGMCLHDVSTGNQYVVSGALLHAATEGGFNGSAYESLLGNPMRNSWCKDRPLNPLLINEAPLATADLNSESDLLMLTAEDSSHEHSR